MEVYEVFKAEKANMVESTEADHEIELKYDDSWVSWCPSHDIIGVASKTSHLVEVYRIENKMEKVVSAQVNSQPTVLEFKRNGRYFAIGDTQGRVSLLKTDTLDEVKSFVLEDSSAPISALAWPQPSRSTQEAATVTEESMENNSAAANGLASSSPFLDFSLHLKTLDSLNPAISQVTQNVLALLKESNEPPSILVACDTNSTVQLSYNGIFPLCQFSVAHLLAKYGSDGHADEANSGGGLRINKVQLSQDWSEMGLLATSSGDSNQTVFIQVDTEAVREIIIDNHLVQCFFTKLPLLELYFEYADKRVTKCKDPWLKFYRHFSGFFSRLADKIKQREARMGSMNPDDYHDPLCTDLLALLVHSKMSPELLEFIQEDLRDTNVLASINEKVTDNLQSIIDEVQDHVYPALKQAIAILCELRANLKAIIAVHGEDSPFTLGFQLSQLNQVVDYMAQQFTLAQVVVAKLTRARKDLKYLLVFLNQHVVKIHTQLYEQQRRRDLQNNQDPAPPQITNMRSDLAKLDFNLPDLQQALERGDRSILLTPIFEAFSEQYQVDQTQQQLQPQQNQSRIDSSNESSRQDSSARGGAGSAGNHDETSHLMPHFADQGAEPRLLQALSACGQTNQVDSTQTMTSLRKATRESQKIIKQMIKSPLAKLKEDDYFEISRLVKATSHLTTTSDKINTNANSRSKVVDFCEDHNSKVFAWIVATCSTDSVELSKIPSQTAPSQSVKTWRARLPTEVTSLQIGQVQFERNDREVNSQGLPTQILALELQDSDQPSGGDVKMVYIKQQDLTQLNFTASGSDSGAAESTAAPLLDIQGLVSLKIKTPIGQRAAVAIPPSMIAPQQPNPFALIDHMSAGNQGMFALVTGRSTLRIYWDQFYYEEDVEPTEQADASMNQE